MLLGFRNSIYWHTGPLELTLGANYYHQHVNSGVTTPSDNDNFVTLKAGLDRLCFPLGHRIRRHLL